MAKYCGAIGYASLECTTPGVWEEVIRERVYFGDVIRNARRLDNSGGVNDNVVVVNQISIVADPYANANFHAIRYVEWMNSKWKVSNVEVAFPRLILTLGGVYNAEQA